MKAYKEKKKKEMEATHLPTSISKPTHSTEEILLSLRVLSLKAGS